MNEIENTTPVVEEGDAFMPDGWHEGMDIFDDGSWTGTEQGDASGEETEEQTEDTAAEQAEQQRRGGNGQGPSAAVEHGVAFVIAGAEQHDQQQGIEGGQQIGAAGEKQRRDQQQNAEPGEDAVCREKADGKPCQQPPVPGAVPETLQRPLQRNVRLIQFLPRPVVRHLRAVYGDGIVKKGQLTNDLGHAAKEAAGGRNNFNPMIGRPLKGGLILRG